MKLRSLIKLTEQAPVAPPMGGPPMGGAPVAAPTPPPGMGAPEQPATPPTPDTSPTPEDPSEYDWTKDFREFEDTKNKAEAEAKKKLLDKMNELLLSKTIVANASRGYGQPKTDYTIQNIKKISVEFWYKDYVVIVADENDKKYFLTPGINIKIEQGQGGEEQGQADAAPAPDGQAPEGQPGAEEPNGGAAGAPPEGGPPTSAPGAQEQPPAEQPAPEPQGQAPAQPAPQKPAAPQPAPQQPAPEEDPALAAKKKKRMQEVAVQLDLSKFMNDFMAEALKDGKGNVDYTKYFVGCSNLVTENTETKKFKFRLEIPVDHMAMPLDIREVKLAAVNALRKVTKYGQYFRGSVEFNKVGRRYLMEYTKETGWNR